MNISNKSIIKISTLILIVAIPFIIWAIISYLKVPDSVESRDKVTVIIPKGIPLSAIADTLKNNNLIDDKDLFLFWITTLDKDRSLKAGYYEVPLDLNYPQLITYLSQARAKEIKVTLIEGWNTKEIAKQLSLDLNIDSTKFMNLTEDSVFIRQLDITAANLEGYLLPDTYFFYWGIDAREIITYLVTQCLNLFDEKVMARLDSINMTRHEILTLASIIEGEAIIDEERDIISSVYHNRLRRRIKLQADPTIQYILDGPPRRLLYKDLEIDSPYNTYKYYGLPPGPIKNPGKKSIEAAIYPATTDYLYFVARGDGKHTFTRSAAEHAREKAKFNKIRREVYRKKNMQTRRDF
jgi:UPF0755 protein